MMIIIIVNVLSLEPSDIDCLMQVDYKEQDYPLSLDECKTLIKELRATNQQQSHEVYIAT